MLERRLSFGTDQIELASYEPKRGRGGATLC